MYLFLIDGVTPFVLRGHIESDFLWADEIGLKRKQEEG